MKNLLFVPASVLLFTACKKPETNPVNPVLASITTTAVTAISQTAATSGGNITHDGGAAITARGVCWNTSSGPTVAHSKTSDGKGTGSFTSTVTGLTSGTTYYLRAYAMNSAGTAYGKEVIFSASPVSEQTVTICSQRWMLKNLDISTYRNGDPIPYVPDPTAWASLTSGAWCYYNNDPSSNATYGKLYNWYAVNDPRGLAPYDRHIPTDAEWATLSTCLGGYAIAGGKMKEAGTAHWASPNTAATNSSGFTALPGGYRNTDGTFAGVGTNGRWWSASEDTEELSWYRSLFYSNNDIYRSLGNKHIGLSVRCIRD